MTLKLRTKNNLEPRIELLEDKKLVGLSKKMSLSDNKTAQLWRTFSPMINKIEGKISKERISMQIYPPSYFQNFDPYREFIKWATVEVETFNAIPEELKVYELDGGTYAVFDYRGSSNDRRIFEYIFGVWLPKSKYQLDDRPHFEVLGENYRNNDPTSEEEIWIPIK